MPPATWDGGHGFGFDTRCPRGLAGNGGIAAAKFIAAGPRPPVGLHSWIEGSQSPRRALEDFAALIGIGLAATGVIASGFLHVSWADGVASVAIGLLLACVAFVLVNETRSLIAGEAVAPIVMDRLNETLSSVGCINDLEEIATLHLGLSMQSWWR